MIDSTFKPNPPTPEAEHQRVVFHSQSETSATLRQVAGHVSPNALVVKDTLNAANSAHGKVLIPQLAGGEVHDILLGDLANGTLDILGAETAACGDDLAANILGDGGGAVKGEEYGSLELSLGALDLGGGHAVAEAGPLTEGEVNQVIELSQVLGNKVDTPESIFQVC